MADSEDIKVVTITRNETGLPIPNIDPILIKKDKQKIRWSASFPFTVDIADYTDVQYSTGGGSYEAKTGSFTSERPHKYSITANDITHDPDIIVKP